VRRLIFNADDYGLTPGVSRGILEAAAGVVRSTSVMVNFVTPEEVAALGASGISAAVHLNLSTGMPCSEGYPEQLCNPDGSFMKVRALDPCTWKNRQWRAAAIIEWNAQIEAARGLGLRFDHLDSHHHTHLLEHLLPAAIDLAANLGVALRVRRPHAGLVKARGIRAPDDLVEAYFGVGCITEEALLKAISTATGSVVEVMCHPGMNDELLQDRSGYRAEREAELAVLRSAALARRLMDLGWEIESYSW
jgi:predicted glycoside hydrolase/deacetylase ChbG (UPF0249 family)